MTLNVDLDDLVGEPRETLDVEVKEWLDLTDGDQRAALAKEIIALANHGGGYIIVGFVENADGQFQPATNRPAKLTAWAQDAIQAVIAKYLDPQVQCRVVHHSLNGTGNPFPVIIVPGGHRVPIRAKASSPDQKKLVENRIYVRRPGPNSEQPCNAGDWDRLLERCLQNRKDELLEAMRSILAGSLPQSVPQTQTKLDQLHAFEVEAKRRWSKRNEGLGLDAPTRLPHGFYDVSFAIDGVFRRPSIAELRTIIQQEVRSHSGWPPFLTISREPYTPRPIDGAIEVWMGPDIDGSFDVPAHLDFWRASPEGYLFTRRGYSEDGGVRDIAPGTSFDITTPTWRLGEAILQASYIARAMAGENANLICHGFWTGLAGRRLVSIGNPNRLLSRQTLSAAQDQFEITETVAISALPDALPELVFAMLSPLYQLFDFFELPKRLVEQELARMRSQRF